MNNQPLIINTYLHRYLSKFEKVKAVEEFYETKIDINKVGLPMFKLAAPCKGVVGRNHPALLPPIKHGVTSIRQDVEDLRIESTPCPIDYLYFYTWKLYRLETYRFPTQNFTKYVNPHILLDKIWRWDGWGNRYNKTLHETIQTEILPEMLGLTARRVAKLIETLTIGFADQNMIPAEDAFIYFYHSQLPADKDLEYHHQHAKKGLWYSRAHRAQTRYRIVVPIHGELKSTYVHTHTLQTFVNREGLQYPDKLTRSVSRFYEPHIPAYISHLTQKLEKLNPFIRFDADLPIGKIQAIPDALSLMNEGDSMKHCIGGIGYQLRCSDYKLLAFHFIPENADPDNLEEHFTGTIRFRSSEIPSQDIDKVSIYLDELSGYKNLKPPIALKAGLEVHLNTPPISDALIKLFQSHQHKLKETHNV